MKDIYKKIIEEFKIVLEGFLDEKALKKMKFLQSVYVLLKSGKSMNKRAIFYDSVPIFKTQTCVNQLVKRYSSIFCCEQRDLNIKSSLKGIFEGKLTFIQNDGNQINFEGKNLIPDMDEILKIEHKYNNVVVIEKDTIFSRVANERYLTVCGKGYPCQNTIKFLKKIENENIRIYCLTDFDPYGLHIYMVYKRYIKSMIRIGLKVEDIFKYKISKEKCIELKKKDMKMIEKLKEDKELAGEAEFIEGLGMKMELEILFIKIDFLDYFLEKVLIENFT